MNGRKKTEERKEAGDEVLKAKIPECDTALPPGNRSWPYPFRSDADAVECKAGTDEAVDVAC